MPRPVPGFSSAIFRAGVLAVAAPLALVSAPAQAAVVISTAATNNMSCSGGVCAPTATDAVLNAGDLETLLASGNVEVTTTGSGVQANDVAVKAALSWSTSSTLALAADRSVAIDEPVAVAGTGGLSLADDGQVGALAFRKPGSVTFANLSSSLSINGTAYTLVNTLPSLAGAIANNPSGAYALASNYNAGLDGTYSSSPVATPFTGTFEGLGNTVSSLSIYDTTSGDYVGLFGDVETGGALRDIRLANETIEGPSEGTTGGLVGLLDEALVYGSSTSGSISVVRSVPSVAEVIGGIAAEVYDSSVVWSSSSAKMNGKDGAAVGGLVGSVGAFNSGSLIKDSYATGSVKMGNTRNDGTSAGGLIASVNTGNVTVAESYATGNVSGGRGRDSYYGGLIGGGGGTISNCYATGNVSSLGKPGYMGGLVGSEDVAASSIASSYSTGMVSGVKHSIVGGFIGDNGDPVSYGYWDTTTSGTDKAVGMGESKGIEGLTTSQLQAKLPEGFDKKIWAEDPDINGGLPYLRAIPPK